MYHETPPERYETLKEQEGRFLSKSEAKGENRQEDGRIQPRPDEQRETVDTAVVGQHERGEMAGNFLQKASAGHGSGKWRECVSISVRSAELASCSCNRKEENVSTEAHVFASGMRSGASVRRIVFVGLMCGIGRKAMQPEGKNVFAGVKDQASETHAEASRLCSPGRIRHVRVSYRCRRVRANRRAESVSGTCAEAPQLRSSRRIQRVGSEHRFRHCPCEPACGIGAGFMQSEGGNRVRCSAKSDAGNVHRSVTVAFIQMHPARRIIASRPLSLVRIGVRNRCRVHAAGKRKADWSECRR